MKKFTAKKPSHILKKKYHSYFCRKKFSFSKMFSFKIKIWSKVLHNESRISLGTLLPCGKK